LKSGDRNIVFTGIQPSGIIHIGNYVGAIRGLRELIEKHTSYCCIVDYHAMTVPYDVSEFSNHILDAATVNLACGIDPDKAVLYVQSDVPQHTELQWLLSCLTPLGLASRMAQFKEKSRRQKESVCIGLLTYPILQAADILLYKANLVPVGQDQVQHIEFSRDLARAFNQRYGDCFPEPEAILGETPKILGTDGNDKMSKSLNNYIAVTESKEEIWKKLRPAKTDEARKRKNDPGEPTRCNIFTIHRAFSRSETNEDIISHCRAGTIGCIDCKRRLLESMVEELTPIRERYLALRKSPKQVEEILATGASTAREVAMETMEQARELVGIRPIPRQR